MAGTPYKLVSSEGTPKLWARLSAPKEFQYVMGSNYLQELVLTCGPDPVQQRQFGTLTFEFYRNAKGLYEIKYDSYPDGTRDRITLTYANGDALAAHQPQMFKLLKNRVASAKKDKLAPIVDIGLLVTDKRIARRAEPYINPAHPLSPLPYIRSSVEWFNELVAAPHDGKVDLVKFSVGQGQGIVHVRVDNTCSDCSLSIGSFRDGLGLILAKFVNAHQQIVTGIQVEGSSKIPARPMPLPQLAKKN